MLAVYPMLQCCGGAQINLTFKQIYLQKKTENSWYKVGEFPKFEVCQTHRNLSVFGLYLT